jgi:hypothetical protein
MPEQHDDESVWYRLGYTVERARSLAPRRERGDAGEHRPRRTRRGPLRSPAERLMVEGDLDATAPAPLLPGESPTGEPWEAVIAAAAAALAGRFLDALPRKRRPGLLGLMRAGAAGAAAALLRELARPMITGMTRDQPFVEAARGAALAGAARGFLYAGLIDPRVPGPPILRGAAYGLVEHLVSPWGGLTTIAGPRAPHRTIPFLADLFDDFEPSDDTLVDHLVFGIALAAIYGAWSGEEDSVEEAEEDD